MTQLKMLSSDDKLAEIRRLYFETSRETIQKDLEKALDLLKSMHDEDERDRAAVYMEGLAEMRSDWLKTPKGPKGGGRAKSKPPKAKGSTTTGPKAAARPGGAPARKR